MPNVFIGMNDKLIKYFNALCIKKKSAFIPSHENERIYQVRTVRYRSNFEGNG